MLVKDKAKLDATEVLQLHGTGRFPVDPARIARQMGLSVAKTMLAPNISGMLQVEPGATPQIYVDHADVIHRQRFTIAHELGHFYERVRRGDTDFNFIDRRGGQYDVHEFYADEFAGNLLMPEDEVRRLWSQNDGLATMADHFGVSLPAMKTRLKRLGMGR
ncbi:ImmA/IrrE family metallo-endopeptidase [Cellulomonas endometrii]|uniref:ImmA/IrrE family metallo-endopeptidase n=1 Tax=Cellulomonas endometrii TaxID=3036301 RepID=UPI0024ACDE2D|nr:ImmA/IrrE family metallo-endopeptidase [Cellulomonas endometrii]